MAAGGTDGHPEHRTQRAYARLAGFLFLWLIVTGVTSLVITSRIVGGGPFADAAQRVVVSERLYRFALCCALVETLSALLLAFSLYVTLKPVNALLAQLGMYWRIAESFVGMVGVAFGFVKLRIYTSQPIAAGGQAQALLDLMRQVGTATYNIGALCFSIGSLLFFYLFYRSHYVPRALSAFGIFASVVVTVICFGSLLFPERSAELQYGWAPMAIAEVATGFWLMFGVRIPGRAR
jgi:Domain of unknown function (DUF4386)